jgi:hypothetical protein
MAIVKTIIKVPTLDQQYSIPQEWSASQIQTMYAAHLPSIGSMVATTQDVEGTSGTERHITFSPRAGNKG